MGDVPRLPYGGLVTALWLSRDWGGYGFRMTMVTGRLRHRIVFAASGTVFGPGETRKMSQPPEFYLKQ